MIHDLPDLASAFAAIDLLDHQTVDWPRVRRSAYIIHQHLRYEYPGPIRDLQQRLVILPPPIHGDQHLIDHRLAVSNAEAETSYRTDAFGNTEIVINVPRVEQTIDFEAWILIERRINEGRHSLPAHALTNQLYLLPSRLTQPDKALHKLAGELQSKGRQGIELAHLINARVYEIMSYAHNVTTIRTTAAEALALKQGVCQDYAHIMVALCRLCGLSARYVSGHLLGEGGTHAWVEVLLPVKEDPEAALVLALDPTHGRSAGISYVTVAVGGDYFDVAPTSGTYSSAYSGQLATRKRVGLTLYEYAA